MKQTAEPKVFKAQAQAINFYLSHKTHYVGIAEKQGTYVVIPRNK